MYRPVLAVLLLVALFAPLAPSQPPSAVAAPMLQAEPAQLVNDTDVFSYDINANAVYWSTVEACIPALLPPDSPQTAAAPQAAGDGTESIVRIPADGGTTRTLFNRTVNQIGGGCTAGSTFRSNLVADTDYVYWIATDGRLVRLSRDANPGDTPALVAQQIFQGYPSAVNPIELADGGDYLFVISTSSGNSTIYRVRKSDGALSTVVGLNSAASGLAAEGGYVYWMRDGCAYRGRFLLLTGWQTTTLECGGVTAIFPEGERTFCLFGCSTTDYVFIGKGKQIIRHNNLTGDEASVYTSPSSSSDVAVGAITGDGINIYFFERRLVPCSPQPCFSSYDTALYRSGRFNANNAGLLYFDSGDFGGNTALRELRVAEAGAAGRYLFWKRNGGIARLPADAEAIPVINMRVTGIEITQAIQDLDNSVRLIRDKRTFARVYVESDGASVAAVRATLRATWSGGSAEAISPSNPGGWKLTVVNNPNRTNIDQSFLFELPLEWTHKPNLSLHAELNPQELPPEPTYSDNTWTFGPVNFAQSPRLPVRFYAWGYELGGTTYYPRYQEDILQSYSWIRRAYPISSLTPSGNGPGLAPELSYVFDAALGSRVDQTSETCEDLVTYNTDGTIADDDRNACAGRYIRSRMRAWRTEAGESRPYFGWTSTAAGFFTRGAAGNGAGSAPAGTMCCGANWDTDGAITDWYTGHEIGHLLGRGHPGPAADNPLTSAIEGCGHSPDDPNFPYAGARIGPNSGTFAGFDSGWWNLPKAVYPANIWTDMMSYCNNQWISDYTYDGIFDFLSSAQLTALPSPAQGDLLSVFGAINPSGETAALEYVRRLSSVGDQPVRVPGPYSLRLRGANGAQLADYPFTPTGDADEDELVIAEVVPFVAGARTLQVVRLADGAILGTASISANPPTISGVTVAGAPGPIGAELNLSWTANDADGDALRFDVHYSADGGTTFQPVAFNLSETSAQLDTSELAGSANAVVRIVATDGVHSAQASSAPFTMAGKAPRPFISAPADGTTVQWGTPIVFVGEALDLQDGYLADAQLTWRRQGRTPALGTGATITVDDLPVGTHTISLIAENSAGQTATTSITVIVADDLAPPPPTLSVAPSQIGWQIAPGAGAQTTTLSIANIGTGGLTWSATTNAPWLSVGAANGSTPATLTLTANPAGIAAGTTASAQVTISATVNSEVQSIVVPVTLTVGAPAFNEPPGAAPAGRRLFLPLLRR